MRDLKSENILLIIAVRGIVFLNVTITSEGLLELELASFITR